MAYLVDRADMLFMVSRAGATTHWWSSPRGQSSSLTLEDGTCFAVDFTRASGADVMPVTTAKADGQTVKVGDTTVTFHFPTQEKPPRVSTQGSAATVGRQRVTLEDGNLMLGVTGE